MLLLKLKLIFRLFLSFLVLFFLLVPCVVSFPASTHGAFDYHICLMFFLLETCFNQMLVSWSQVCLLIPIAVFETVRSYPFKKEISCSPTCSANYKMLLYNTYSGCVDTSRCEWRLACHRWNTDITLTELLISTASIGSRVSCETKCSFHGDV